MSLTVKKQAFDLTKASSVVTNFNFKESIAHQVIEQYNEVTQENPLVKCRYNLKHNQVEEGGTLFLETDRHIEHVVKLSERVESLLNALAHRDLSLEDRVSELLSDVDINEYFEDIQTALRDGLLDALKTYSICVMEETVPKDPFTYLPEHFPLKTVWDDILFQKDNLTLEKETGLEFYKTDNFKQLARETFTQHPDFLKEFRLSALNYSKEERVQRKIRNILFLSYDQPELGIDANQIIFSLVDNEKLFYEMVSSDLFYGENSDSLLNEEDRIGLFLNKKTLTIEEALKIIHILFGFGTDEESLEMEYDDYEVYGVKENINDVIGQLKEHFNLTLGTSGLLEQISDELYSTFLVEIDHKVLGSAPKDLDAFEFLTSINDRYHRWKNGRLNLDAKDRDRLLDEDAFSQLMFKPDAVQQLERIAPLTKDTLRQLGVEEAIDTLIAMIRNRQVNNQKKIVMI